MNEQTSINSRIIMTLADKKNTAVDAAEYALNEFDAWYINAPLDRIIPEVLAVFACSTSGIRTSLCLQMAVSRYPWLPEKTPLQAIQDGNRSFIEIRALMVRYSHNRERLRTLIEAFQNIPSIIAETHPQHARSILAAFAWNLCFSCSLYDSSLEPDRLFTVAQTIAHVMSVSTRSDVEVEPKVMESMNKLMELWQKNN